MVKSPYASAWRITHEDVIEGRHFDDDIMSYGFHDNAPRLQIKNGGTYGLPHKALRVKGIDGQALSLSNRGGCTHLNLPTPGLEGSTHFMPCPKRH